MCEELEVEFKFQVSSQYTKMLEKMGAQQIKVGLVNFRQVVKYLKNWIKNFF